MEKDAILETLDRQVRVELKVATCEEAIWKREKGTEMKDLKRKEDKVVMRIQIQKTALNKDYIRLI